MNNQYTDVEDVACYLSVTSSLAAMLSDKCLRTDRSSIATTDVYSALCGLNTYAYDFVCDYGFISDKVHILEDRLTKAEKMLDEIVNRKINIIRRDK